MLVKFYFLYCGGIDKQPQEEGNYKIHFALVLGTAGLYCPSFLRHLTLSKGQKELPSNLMCEKILAFLVFRNQVCKISNRKDNDGVQLLSHTEVTVIEGSGIFIVEYILLLLSFQYPPMNEPHFLKICGLLEMRLQRYEGEKIAFTSFPQYVLKWYFVTKIVLTYCEKKLF